MAVNHKHHNHDDIDSKIADFMADIDEIVHGKKSRSSHDDVQNESEWKQCFDETTQAVYYWNTKTNECSWDPPSSKSMETNAASVSKRSHPVPDRPSPKKQKKPSLIAEYTSSSEEDGSDEEGNVDDIDELLNEVLEKKENLKKRAPSVDPFPTFEEECRNAIARLVALGDRTTEMLILRIQLETRLEDCLAGHLPKVYAMNKLNEALIRIEEFEKLPVISAPLPVNPEPVKAPLTNNEMTLLLSLPPPPPPPSPPLLPSNPTVPTITATPSMEDPTLQQFYAELNAEPSEQASHLSETTEKNTNNHHHPRHAKDKKLKPVKGLPTDLIQKWTHARQELRSFGEIDES